MTSENSDSAGIASGGEAVGPDLRVNTYKAKSGWSWRIKAARVLWAPFKLLFLPGTTRYLSPLRRVVLRWFGAKIHPTALILDGVQIWYPWNLEMAAYSTLGRRVEVYNFARISIGEQSTVSQYVYLCTATHDHAKSNMPLVYFPITIEDQVWIAAGVFVGPGVRIGQGSVVGARSVVVSDILPWRIVAGNPARYLRDRVLNES